MTRFKIDNLCINFFLCIKFFKLCFQISFIVTRIQWTEGEENELREYLHEFIGKKCPGMKACKYAIEQSRRNNGQLHRRKWDTIKKKIVRMKPL